MMKSLKHANGKKSPVNLTLDIGVVKETRKNLKNYNVSLSGHIEQLLDQWCQNQEENEVFGKIMQEALENLRNKKIPNKDLTAIDVINSKDKKRELLDEVEKIVKKNSLQMKKCNKHKEAIVKVK